MLAQTMHFKLEFYVFWPFTHMAKLITVASSPYHTPTPHIPYSTLTTQLTPHPTLPHTTHIPHSSHNSHPTSHIPHPTQLTPHIPHSLTHLHITLYCSHEAFLGLLANYDLLSTLCKVIVLQSRAGLCLVSKHNQHNIIPSISYHVYVPSGKTHRGSPKLPQIAVNILLCSKALRCYTSVRGKTHIQATQ